jgi:hypothetical protein
LPPSPSVREGRHHRRKRPTAGQGRIRRRTSELRRIRIASGSVSRSRARNR